MINSLVISIDSIVSSKISSFSSLI